MKMRQHRKQRQAVSREWVKVRTRHLKYLRICLLYNRHPSPICERSLVMFTLAVNRAYSATKIGINSAYRSVSANATYGKMGAAKSAHLEPFDPLVAARVRESGMKALREFQAVINPPPRFQISRIDYENGDFNKLRIVQPLPLINPLNQLQP